MRAESAGSFTNRRGSSVNGVNEEWEQTKCAEMKEVPPHCIRPLLSVSTYSPKHEHKLAHNSAFCSFTSTFAIPICYISAPIDTKPCFLNPLAPLGTFCYFHTLFSTLPLSHRPTCTLSSPVLSPYVSLFPLIKCAGPSLASLLFPGEITL